MMRTNKFRFHFCISCALLFQSTVSFSPSIIHSTLIQQIDPNNHERNQKHVLTLPHSKKRVSSFQRNNPLNTLSPYSLTYKSKPKYATNLKSTANNNNDNSNIEEDNTNKASVALSSSITPQNLSSPTAVIDYLLSILTSDIGSIIIGSIGLLIALYNRLSTIDFDPSAVVSETYAESINIQSRNDLLAVFASGAVLLNGISKLDVTSVLAESVVLNGYKVDDENDPLYVNQDEQKVKETMFDQLTNERREDLNWAMKAVLSATPAKTAVLLASTMTMDKGESGSQSTSTWVPIIMSGILPFPSSTTESMTSFGIPNTLATPILDRFLKQENAKESYLPTLQALPGKVEFTYLPDNTQEALLLPIKVASSSNSSSTARGAEKERLFALALGSDTAKSFTPRDVAWCQVLARRMGTFMVG